MDDISYVKFSVTGRPEPRIRSEFCLELPILVTEALNSAPELLFRTRLATVAKSQSYCELTGEWPSPSNIHRLCLDGRQVCRNPRTIHPVKRRFPQSIASGGGRSAVDQALRRGPRARVFAMSNVENNQLYIPVSTVCVGGDAFAHLNQPFRSPVFEFPATLCSKSSYRTAGKIPSSVFHKPFADFPIDLG